MINVKISMGERMQHRQAILVIEADQSKHLSTKNLANDT